MKKIGLSLLSVLLLASCVSSKKFNEMKAAREAAEAALARTTTELKDCDDAKVMLNQSLTMANDQVRAKDAELSTEKNRSKSLEEQLEYMKATNTTLLARLSDLSVVSKASAESIKKSLDAIDGQSKYIQGLTSSIQQKDSMNLALVMNLKQSLDNINDEDVTVEVKKGVVYISLSDKMLFRSGSAVITSAAENVLSKIAKILNDQKDLDILVEGHTDNVPISTDCFADNWDLSAKRATSVVRTLHKKYNVAPERMTAGGRSEYVPLVENTSTAGKSKNRRTEIIILPKLDQFFQMMEP
jgi:chemotaxis protein MotB